MNSLVISILAVAAPTPTGPSNVGLGSVVLTLAIGVFLAWAGYLVINSRRRKRAAEKPPPNLEKFVDDAELENNRLTRVLAAAVIAAAVLAIVMPIYFVNESGRQEAAAEEIAQSYVDSGQELWQRFQCSACHGPDGGGGSASIVEARSKLKTAWSVPSLNDVFFRYDEAEVRHWIVNGRAGTPMPANGLEGGGAMTGQEIDQVIAYVRTLQLPQLAAFDKVDAAVDGALRRIEGGHVTVEARLIEEQARLADVEDGPAQFALIETMPDEIATLLSEDETCTVESAALVGTACNVPGIDTDRDGVTDQAETSLNDFAADAYLTLTTRVIKDGELTIVPDSGLALDLSPQQAFSMTDAAGQPVPDLDSVAAFLTKLSTARLQLQILNEGFDQFAEGIRGGIGFLEASLAAHRWDVDFDQVAGDTGLSVSEARRAVGLFNSSCARCHTGGYSAGVAFEQAPGSGAWGPSLRDGRAITQFPDIEDQIDFIIKGATASANYGVNGLSGVGGMPGFGAILSREDIELIVKYERSL